MQKITPFLWFNNNVEEATNFYITLFKNSRAVNITRYGEAGPGPKGTVMNATFRLHGQDFFALNGGPLYAFTPAISFFVSCDTQEEIYKLWEKLSEGGSILMELDKYPFSEKYGWIADRFGLSWQLNLASRSQKIVPCLLYVGKQAGKSEEAMQFYTSIFQNSDITSISRYEPGEGDVEGTVKHATFQLDGSEFIAMDSSLDHHFTFTPATSLFVDCKSQNEVDKFWEELSEGGEKQQCGWLIDKYGVSWQVIPSELGEMLQDKDPEKSQRVMQAMLQMTKIDINILKQAYEQK